MSGDILYVSNDCKYRKDVLNDLKKHKKVASSFNIQFVENISIPKYVDRVPLICTRSGDVMIDENLFNYIENIKKKYELDIKPFATNEMGGNMSDTYSYVSDDSITPLDHSFSFLDKEGNEDNEIHTPSDENFEEKKLSTVNLEKIMMERENDIQLTIS